MNRKQKKPETRQQTGSGVEMTIYGFGSVRNP